MNKILKHNLDTLNKAARIDEIEKLKAEIDKIRDVEVTDGTVYVSSDDVYEIFDKKIAEIKGE